MSEKGGQRNNHYTRFRTGEKGSEKKDGYKTLQGIKKKGENSPLETDYSCHIRGADISAPLPGDVDA